MTVWRWKRDGYIVMRGGKVDVVRSEARLARRPRIHHGGYAKGSGDRAAERVRS